MRQRVRRRDVLRAAAAGAFAVAGAGVAAGQSGLSEWFSNVSNYDGVADETGSSEVSVSVGASANGGAFGFGPAAVRVDPGTTVVWEWTGEGGSHNVAAEDGSFESELVGESRHTFSHTFEEAGVYRYACTPHKAVGMKGAVVVGDAAADAPAAGEAGSGSEDESTATPEATTAESAATGATGGSDGGGGSGSSSSGSRLGNDDAFLILGGTVGVAALSPIGFGLLLKLVGDGSDGPDERR